ncbi:MAG: winged helix-turn-helix domain-containing protein [Candidatus Hydrothermarchaeales archaeon]
MDFSTIGFLRADRYRLRILEATKSKVAKKQISGRLRIPQALVDKTLKELQGRDLVKEDEDSFLITDKGMKVLAQISRQHA